MCYAIPGKVVSIDEKIVTVDYFGEKRKAKNEFFEISEGDYIYAQGGFVIQRVTEEEALKALDTWKELFFKLKEIDLELTQKPKNLFQRANNLRHKYHGNSCCTHGIIEFSNYCQNDCLYCGLRKSNEKIERYRMSEEEIIEAARHAVKDLNFKALVLQSGEDLWYSEEKLLNIARSIMKEFPVLLILSIGERTIETYQRLYEVGTRGILMRFETSNPELYEKYRPGKVLNERINLIKKLYEFGYLIFTGFLIGIPGQTEEDLINDIDLTNSLNADMFSFGPFIPHNDTPLAKEKKPPLDSILTIIANARLKYPKSRILATTALETLDKENGARMGLLSGANSLMINVTPPKYIPLYDIYPQRMGLDSKIEKRIESVIGLLHSIGRAPSDLGLHSFNEAS